MCRIILNNFNCLISAASNLIQVFNAKKSFAIGSREISVLKNIYVEISNGEFVIIFGPSGSGKSTLLHTMLGLEPPTEWQVKFLDFDFYSMDPDDRADFRKKTHWYYLSTILLGKSIKRN